jgi:hypothetical protein
MTSKSYRRTARKLRILMGAALVTLTATLVLTGVAGAAPSPFKLVFDGHHGPPLGTGFRHEGPFTASAPFCSSGAVVDLQHQGEMTATRLYTCADGSGTATMSVTNFPDEHISGGKGTWRILEGTGAYTALRGQGGWTTVPIGGTDAFQSTLNGIADLDDAAPTIVISRATATKLRSPKGTYRITLVFSARDNVAGNTVSYSVAATAGNDVRSKDGKTVSGPVTVSFRIHPAKAVRRVQVAITASDPLDNQGKLSRSIKLPPLG